MPDGLGQGFVDFTRDDQQRRLQQAALAQQLMQNQNMQDTQAASGPAFEALARLLGRQPNVGAIAPPPPGTPQGGPMPPQPGANPAPPPMRPPMPGPQAGPMQAPPQAGPQMAPPPMAGGAPPGGMMRASMPAGGSPGGGMPAPLPPFKPMPTAAPPQAQQAPGMIGAPPAPAAPAPDAGLNQPPPLPLGKIVADLKASGVPPAIAMKALEQLTPIMNSQNQQELSMFKAQTAAAKATEQFYKDRLQLELNSQKVGVQQQAETRRSSQGNTRLDQGQQKINLAKQQQAGDFTSQDIAYWTEVLQKGGSLPPRLATTPGGKRLMADVMKGTARGNVSPVEMLANQAEFMGEKAGQRTLGTRTANIEMAATEAAGLSSLALKASDEWNRTGIKSLNDLEKYAQGKTASPTLRRFVAANTSFINAYARAINPQGVGTVADKEHAREMLEVGFAKNDYAAAIEQLQQEISVAQKSPGKVKESMRERFVGGGDRKSAPQEAIDYLKEHPETSSQFSAKYGYLPAGAR